MAVVEGDQLIDIGTLAESLDTPFVPDLLELIDLGVEGIDHLVHLLDRARESGLLQQHVQPLTESVLLAPLDPPRGNVVAIGRNYAEHASEIARARGGGDDKPTVFTKAQTTICGPFDDILVDPEISSQIDWEAELGVVIGRPALNVGSDEALSHVFGYVTLNDVSARDLQYGWGGQFFKGKSLDGYCPTGPWIVTADEVPDPQRLRVTLRVNGEVKQQGTTKDMIFPVAELISQLSKGMTLPAGTLIATGTPPGVGYGRDPKEFLKAGDLMETDIEGIGYMRNRIVGPHLRAETDG